MKKLILGIGVFLSINSSKGQGVYNEYIDVGSHDWNETSYMIIYNNAPDTLPAEYFSIGRYNSNYHWVKYTGAYKVIVNMSDNIGEFRELCIKHGDQHFKCDTVIAHQTMYELFAFESTLQVWISKPFK